jgi:hypothetical protein
MEAEMGQHQLICACALAFGVAASAAAQPRLPAQQVFFSPAGEPFRAPRGEPYPVAAWFAQADANKDGALDLTEFLADATRFFKSLDQNADGLLSGVEVQRYERDIAPEASFNPMQMMEGRPRGMPMGMPPGGAPQVAAPQAA